MFICLMTQILPKENTDYDVCISCSNLPWFGKRQLSSHMPLKIIELEHISSTSISAFFTRKPRKYQKALPLDEALVAAAGSLVMALMGHPLEVEILVDVEACVLEAATVAY